MAKTRTTGSKSTSKASKSKSASKAGASTVTSAVMQKVSFSKAGKAAKSVPKSGAGSFVLGRKAFARISAVEGVVLSKSMQADLRRLEDASPAERRMVLVGKYGKG